MNLDDLRAAYDFHRQNSNYPETERVVLPNLVRFIQPIEKSGFILYSNLDESNAEQVIQEQVDYFSHLGYGFEWKLMSYDQPRDLKDRLAAHGFEVEEDESILILPVEEAPAVLFEPVRADIRKLTEPAQLDELLAFKKLVYPDLDLSWIRSEFGRRMVEHPDTISIYMAYLDGAAVASGWTFFSPSTSFAGFYGGATHPGYRKRGLYNAMLAMRLQEVRQRGFRFVNVDAGSMSQPILMKMGFQEVAVSNPCQWSPPATAV